MREIFELGELESHGVFLRVNCIETADELDDYLTEKCYVLFEQAMEPDHVVFYFGKAASLEKVAEITENFRSDH